jgi:hypothetical protein
MDHVRGSPDEEGCKPVSNLTVKQKSLGEKYIQGFLNLYRMVL